ncbi:MAG TPA: PotD/PotF family extracellular solute-binding protein [Alphaproteobacteria bacterium]|nr:PotD/PotF family extracellular solute-binding protein [Alphaproteobacteria bacterium]
MSGIRSTSNGSSGTESGRGLSRRRLLGGAAVAAGAVAFRPCAPFISNAEAAETSLRLLMWQPYAIKETIEQFEADTGARFSPTFFDGNSEAFNKMKVGGTKDFDIVQADGFWPRLYFKQGLTQGVDYGKIPNTANVFPEFLPSSFKLLATPDGATNVAAPNCWGGYGITVNTSKVAAEDIGSIGLLLNDKYAGKLSTNSRFEENIALMGILAATNLGTINGDRPDGQPFNPYNLTDAELEETKKLLIVQKKLLMTRYQDYDALDRLMRGGAIWAAPEFAETYRHLTVLRKEGKLDFDVQHVLKPKEGGLGWVDTWMISSGANSEQTELAHKWINQYLTKENFARVVRSTGYGGTVDVRELLKPDEIELYFQEKSADASQLHMFDQPSSPEKWERIWSDVEAS